MKGYCDNHTRYTKSCDECREAGAARQRAAVQRRRLEGLPAEDPRHGKSTTYTNHGCRCDHCTAAWRERCATARERRMVSLEPNDPRHGDPHTYSNYRCRCDLCRRARNEYNRKLRERNGSKSQVPTR